MKRTYFIPVAAAILASVLGAFAQTPSASKAPTARVEPVKNTYFGETLVDPYRWMENEKDTQWLPFLKGQNSYSQSVLGVLPNRADLLARIQQLSGDTAVPAEVQTIASKIFYQQRPAGSNNYKLFVRDGIKDRTLVDPTALDTATSHYSLDWWQVSPDGKLLVFGLSKDGSEDSVLHLMNVETGEMSPERIENTATAYPQWLSDSSGFFYNQLTGKVDTPERFLDSRARFHRIGSNVGKDPILMRRGLDPRVKFDKIQAPNIFTSQSSNYSVLVLKDVRSELRLLIAPTRDVLAGTARWQTVADFKDEVTAFELHGDALWALGSKDHPRGRLVQIQASAPSIASAKEVVAESAMVLQGLARSKDGLYIRAMDGGLGRLLFVGADGKVALLAMPFDSTIDSLTADPSSSGAKLILSGWLTPTGIWSIDASGTLSDTGITPKPAIDTSSYVTERRFATSIDGTLIPYSLIYRKGLKRDGHNPAYVSAYGSYGANGYTPEFAGRTLALIDQGAIVGYANVRGGGEYGRDWHRAGQLENKPNTWRDLIAVTQDMVIEKYTDAAHLAIGGRSAGGITVGRALTERPELFAAVVSGVGWHNPIRYVAEQNGFGEEPEWGAIREERGYRALKTIDSYHAVKDGVKYPAVLLTTGVTDPRVAPFHPAKMAARLQAATASGKPILLRVDFDAGHGMGSTRSQQDQEAADTYAFILWQTTLDTP